MHILSAQQLRKASFFSVFRRLRKTVMAILKSLCHFRAIFPHSLACKWSGQKINQDMQYFRYRNMISLSLREAILLEHSKNQTESVVWVTEAKPMNPTALSFLNAYTKFTSIKKNKKNKKTPCVSSVTLNPTFQ